MKTSWGPLLKTVISKPKSLLFKAVRSSIYHTIRFYFMGTFNAFYIRASKNDVAVMAAVQKQYPGRKSEASSQFIGVALSDDDFEAPESDLATLSRVFNTDVIWLSIQSTVDAFQFHHWKGGERTRSLIYGCFQMERTWERAEGLPEPWEKETFFEPTKLTHLFHHANSNAERQRLKAIWEKGEILAGNEEPSVDSKECAHQIARHYQLPHYGL